MIESLIGTHADWVVGIARIVLGIIFFAHGAQKMLGWYGGPGLASSMRTFTEHLHLPSTLAFLVIAGELFSGIGLIVGLFSRIAAVVIVLTMVGVIATVHFRFGLFINWLGKRLSTSSTSSRAGSVISQSQQVRKPGISQQWELLHEPAGIFATHWCYRCCGIDVFLQSNQFCGGDSVESD